VRDDRGEELIHHSLEAGTIAVERNGPRRRFNSEPAGDRRDDKSEDKERCTHEIFLLSTAGDSMTASQVV
jgi:hypothetical protein